MIKMPFITLVLNSVNKHKQWKVMVEYFINIAVSLSAIYNIIVIIIYIPVYCF